MNAKDKAKELVEKFKNIEITMFGCEENNPCVISNKMFDNSAKQCAIIAVDEILNIYSNFKKHPQYIYWYAVKKEIQNL